MRRMVGYGMRVYVATVLGFLVVRIDLLLVNGYDGTASAGLYAVAVAIADALYILPSVVAVNLFAHAARGSTDSTSAAVFRAFGLLYAVVCALSALFAPIAIELVYGDKFSDAAELYRWLAPGIFCYGMVNILAQHFAARGFPLEAVLVWGVGLALNLGLNLWLLPDHGTWVASMAATATYALLLVLHVRLFVRTSPGAGSLWPSVGESVTLLKRVVARARPEPAG